jgi:hypothetical protein
MSDVRTGYGTSGLALTITLTSLADSSTAGRESLAVDNSSDKFLDVLISGKIKTQNSGTISAPSAVFIWAAATVDAGTTWPDTITGTDAAITFNAPTQLKLLGVIYVAAINTTYKAGPFSLASLYGGKMPAKWSIAVQNDCGTALTATAGDHVFQYQGIFATVV